ncbi:1,4-alpha-glucan branching protein domain-containing protein [Desulfolucanica intricata]|uniref:1,4-alpha-glucan branching protein domain-containing protein n=1 Tax=Desulfolucanica intricata TaxID=1285191 RepID=UPI00082F9C21|nr:1,4-alpha-glucan branching protein domain-containing protein [Desulfolucanica intricata]
MSKGYLAIVLHAHMPFVRHLEKKNYLEERWLYEVVTDCYIPMLQVFFKLVKDGVDFRLTFSISPTVLAMLTDPVIQDGYRNYLMKRISLARAEVQRNSNNRAVQQLAEYYLLKFEEVYRLYNDTFSGNILNSFYDLQRAGYIELITTCATHGYLPLMRTIESRRAQVKVGLDEYIKHFDSIPPGIWLPECGYVPGVEQILREYGLDYFFVDTVGMLMAYPRPRYGTLAPVRTLSGQAVFGRDDTCSRQVWDHHSGYPGDPYYREFYRDIGYDLDWDYLKPYLPEGGLRVDTGLKYYRITGSGVDKKLYQPWSARSRAQVHAEDFVCRCKERAGYYSKYMTVKPILTASYDAELFGHWWYEGPIWLEFVCRSIFRDRDKLEMITPSHYLAENPPQQAVELPMSSWGAGGYSQVWINPKNDWIYRHLHRAEEKIVHQATIRSNADGIEKQALNQACRELLLAQSSDWSFIINAGTTTEYAKSRFQQHIKNFNLLMDQIENKKLDPVFLAGLEQQNNLFNNLDYHIYDTKKIQRVTKKSSGILMLSWEYPPKTVGGLARHVYDLSQALAKQGENVHVLTCPAPGVENYQLVNGVHVHRVPENILTCTDFMGWVEQLNTGMIEMGSKLYRNMGGFDLIHAHDWLVGRAGSELSKDLGLPLVATIHATEYGRNQGLRTPLQLQIHRLESKLIRDAKRIVCCSSHMKREVTELFKVEPDSVRIIPNGVNLENTAGDIDSLCRIPDLLLFYGRLVPEKGVQVLLRALPHVLRKFPKARLIVAGKGPYESYLKNLAGELGLNKVVSFPGFVDENTRKELLRQAGIAVFPSLYEPFGIVALEAMAAGVPIIVSDTGGMSDIVTHGVDGYKVEPGNTEKLAFYIKQLLANPLLAEDMRLCARENVLVRFNWEGIACETREVYQEVMNLSIGNNSLLKKYK